MASPSLTMIADVNVVSSSAAMSNGGSASVSTGPPNTNDSSTSAGITTSAMTSELLRITLIAYSGRFLAASRIPATFSTALPAIATTTIPANACDICIISIAGSSALTNHSDTSAAPSDASTSTMTAMLNGQTPCGSAAL